uniref:Uncharacterized protein n=1 Tax=Magallana gigas TaxID=29159 RepID=A0A8W8I368_MAGGI|nr:uncharacterized protein LOC105322411 [Crassostrea gigas]
MDQIEQSLVEDKRRRIVEHVQVELLKRLLPRRSPQMAKKCMQRIQDHHEKMMENHRELLMVINEKKGQELKNGDVFNKLSEANENRLEAIRESMHKEKKDRLLEDILVHLVRSIRTRRNPQMARKIMIMLQENHTNLLKLQEDLLIKVKERDDMHRAKRAFQEEMMTKVNERKLLDQIKRLGYRDLMICQVEKPEEEGDFLPRKLFVFGVDTFRCTAKFENEVKVEKRKELTLATKLEDECQVSSPLVTCSEDNTCESLSASKDQTKRSKKSNFVRRIKKFFGIR